MNVIRISAAALLVACAGCAGNRPLIEVGDVNAEKKVLIAVKKTDFKSKVIDRVARTLEKESYYIKVVGLDELDYDEAQAYGAIVIFNSRMVGRMNPRVYGFLKKGEKNPKVIVFTTVANEKRSNKVKVDIITSASKPHRVEEKSDELIALIRKRF
ncbi:MAG: hypothetical protein ABIJ56_06275 [Pseudomonadota bacterium]